MYEKEAFSLRELDSAESSQSLALFEKAWRGFQSYGTVGKFFMNDLETNGIFVLLYESFEALLNPRMLTPYSIRSRESWGVCNGYSHRKHTNRFVTRVQALCSGR
jgi:hypothetical protein